MNPYLKAVTAVYGALLTLLHAATTPGALTPVHWIPTVVAILTAAGVYLVPNGGAAPTSTSTRAPSPPSSPAAPSA